MCFTTLIAGLDDLGHDAEVPTQLANCPIRHWEPNLTGFDSEEAATKLGVNLMGVKEGTHTLLSHALVHEGRQVKQTAVDLGIYQVTLHSWLRQDAIDRGRRPEPTSREIAALRFARRRIRQLEQKLSTLQGA